MIGLWVALAGGLGATARYVLDGAISSRHRGPVPIATLTINVLGSFLLGLVAGGLGGLSPTWVRVLGVGVLGGFTTFSTASVELVRLARDERPLQALGLALTMIIASLAAAMLGLWLAG